RPVRAYRRGVASVVRVGGPYIGVGVRRNREHDPPVIAADGHRMADGESTARDGDVGSLCEPQKWTGSRILQAAYVIGPGPGRAEHTLRPNFELSTANAIADATARHLAAIVLDERVDLDV